MATLIFSFSTQHTDCQAKYKSAGVMSCGNYQQNCCDGTKCRQKENFYSSSLKCDQRNKVQRCTTPKDIQIQYQKVNLFF
ncbi:unnamed protein product [Paramecium octaurelia]|uniref:Uncharacterized protein n=1 Tax=Paramecium octaurelia TaxID=43137 RepID=A0A8S1TV88_PAROT|nr:unnamed protein product [Paramecium octaurelia]